MTKPDSGLALPRPVQAQLRVAPGRYILLGIGFWLAMAILFVRIDSGADYGLQRLGRLESGAPTFLADSESESRSADILARDLDVRPEEVLAAQFVVEEYLNAYRRDHPRTWSRAATIDLGEAEIHIGAPAFLAAIPAIFFAWFFHTKKRWMLAMELVAQQRRIHDRLKSGMETELRESHKIIERFNRLKDQLVQAEKLASVGRLAATLAHEIRNPLTIIRSTTELVADDLPADSQGRATVALIREEIDRLDRIITDLLSFARPRPAKIVRVQIKTLVRHWLPPVVEELEKAGIRLVPQLEHEEGWAMADPDQLYQVFLNLVWNARDALAGLPNPHIFVRTEDAGEKIRLVIQDTGPGMLPETLRQVREPFFTTKTQGSGLGIPLSAQLLEGMDATLDIQSELSVGTTATISLPRAKGAESEMPEELW